MRLLAVLQTASSGKRQNAALPLWKVIVGAPTPANLKTGPARARFLFVELDE